MKKLYSFLFISLCCLAVSCSKDSLKRYESRIEGVWRLTDVDKRGIGGNTNNVTFGEGEFEFFGNGDVTWTNSTGNVYRGSWDIRRRQVSNGCSTDNNGNTNCSDREVKTLTITVVDFVTQHLKSEFFDEIIFTGTNRFKTYEHSGLHTYVFHFRR